jgi:hypothetical protein
MQWKMYEVVCLGSVNTRDSNEPVRLFGQEAGKELTTRKA